ncbi:MAG: acetolactate synthase large subunit [bacterium]
MKASDLFTECLLTEGVEYVFTVPGEENLDLLESLRTSSIKVLVTRHEQGAAFMAASYARLTGKVGVCLATLGPGATNLVTGVAYAQLGGIPLLAITGQKGIRENWQADFQVIDVVRMMEPITKRTKQIQGPKSIPREIREVFKVATTERLGACHLELPEDVANEEVAAEFRPLVPGVVRRPDPSRKAVKLAAEKIRAAKHPIIIVSSRSQRRLVRRQLRELCDATNLYVIHTQLGKGVLGDDHPNSLFAFGIHKRDHVNCGVDRADLIITVGYSTSEHPPSVWNEDLTREILHVDFNPAHTEIHYNPAVELVGDISTSLRMLREALAGWRYEDPWLVKLREKLQWKLHEEGADHDDFPLRPRRIVADCRRVLGPEDILTLDNGIYKMWFSRHYPAHEIGTFLLDNTLATMGAGLSAALGAKLVYPERRVLAVVGDGGFMMNSQELETAVRLDLPVVVLLVNDNAFGFIKWKQEVRGFTDFALDLGNPDFVKYAESYGAVGLRVESAADLAPKLEQAFSLGRPTLVECPIDYADNMRVWSQELDNLSCDIEPRIPDQR